MPGRSSPFLIRLRGPLACFTRPELKTERVTYEVMTPSAARGALEAILWKPAIVWRIERIRVLSPISLVSIRRNEVNSKVSPESAYAWSSGSRPPDDYFADEDRAQRHTLALRDVDYIVEAHFEMTERRGPSDNMQKFEEMFRRRLERGQCFQRPYLGCREFAADFSSVVDPPAPLELTRDLGRMLFDLDYSSNRAPLFFDAKLVKGVLDVPRVDGRAVA